MRWTLLLLLLTVACEPRGRARDDDDDDDSGDDDSAADDDDTTPFDDDDATPVATSPRILGVTHCQQSVIVGDFAFFEIEVVDDQEDLHSPVRYRVQIDGGPNPTHEWDQNLGGHGWIDHTESISGALTRGVEHAFSFTVLDDQAHVSEAFQILWTIPVDPEAEPCGG